MSVRKREWMTRRGDPREKWLVDYRDTQGARRFKTFKKKKDADAYHASVKVDVAAGIHVAPSKSITVKQAAQDWLDYVRAEKRERGTIANYELAVHRHILPRLGNVKLSALTTPRVQKFRDDLLSDLSRSASQYALARLKAILKDARRRGNVVHNAAADVAIQISSRDRPRLAIGKDIPNLGDVKRLIDTASEGRVRALIMTAAFSGLRVSELRGLRWQDADLKRGVLHVRQRADRFNAIGSPKSRAGERDVPVIPTLVNTLKTWRLACPNKGDNGLVFGTRRNTPEPYTNLLVRVWHPLQIKAGVVDTKGKPRYSGFHCLRHFYASWCINRKAEGGRELPAKTVQTLLGHASIVMTLDRYGHLFPSDDGAELEAADRALSLLATQA
jgi:integrase